MSVHGCRIRAMTTNWTKNTYVCDPDECDTLIEITTSDEFGFPSGTIHNVTCPCGRTPNLLSVEDATIAPTNERNEMQATTEFLEQKIKELQESYNIASDMRNLLQAQVNKIIDNLTVDNWYADTTEKSEVLSDLCEILGHEAKQTVRITATVSVEVDYEIPLDEVEDFDARYFLNDNLTIDTYNGDATVDSWTVEDSDVNW
jgi:hypothetical protein